MDFAYFLHRTDNYSPLSSWEFEFSKIESYLVFSKKRVKKSFKKSLRALTDCVSRLERFLKMIFIYTEKRNRFEEKFNQYFEGMYTAKLFPFTFQMEAPVIV
jgi:hypothetical protein